VEKPITFTLRDSEMLGIVHQPPGPLKVGVLIIVGGPQYRVGSHRQFVQLSRALARENITSMRFDYRGMGDSEGAKQSFEEISEDIRAACDALLAETGLSRLVLWGLCDAASAAMMYAVEDPRIVGLVLVNPWLRSEEAMGRVMVRHYYLQRLLSREFWVKLLSGKVQLSTGVGDAKGFLKDSLLESRQVEGSYQSRMKKAMERFGGRVSLILSGEDLTAREFEQQALEARNGWPIFSKESCVVCRVANADHTFSSSSAKREVERATAELVSKIAVD